MAPPTPDSSSGGGEIEAAAQAFVMELGRALLRIGTPAHRLEEALSLLARRLGMEAEFFSTPTAVLASFQARPFPRTYLVRSIPGEVDLDKLTRLDELADLVARGEIPVPDGVRMIRDVLAARPRHGLPAVATANVFLSAALATVFGCNARQAAVAGAVGLIVGVLRVPASRWPPFGRLFEVAAAAMGSFAASAAGLWAPGAYYLTLVTGLIVLLPGFTLTVALTELSTFHIVSGATRLVGALVVFLQLAFGVALGGRAGAALFGSRGEATLDPVSAWKRIAALACAAFAFTVIYHARPRDTAWILLASIRPRERQSHGQRHRGRASSVGPLPSAGVPRVPPQAARGRLQHRRRPAVTVSGVRSLAGSGREGIVRNHGPPS